MDELQELFKLASSFFIKKYKAGGGTQNTLAKEIGISQSYLSSVTNGSRSASLELYNQIAEKLYAPLDKFLAVGRRIKEGLDPLEDKEDEPPEDSVESLIARLTHYVVDHQRISKEITDLKRFYETIVEKQQAGILVMDKEHTVIFANKSMESLAHISPSMILGTTPYDAGEKIPGLDIVSFREEYNMAFESLKTVSYKNLRAKMPNGEIVFISGSFYPQQKDGVFDGMICTIYETTTSNILRNLLLLTLNYSPQGIAVMQQTEPGQLPKIYYLNKQFQKIFGLGTIDPVQTPFSDTLKLIARTLKNKTNWQIFIKESIGSNKVDARYSLELKNGKTYEWICNPLIDEQGTHWGRIVTISNS